MNSCKTIWQIFVVAGILSPTILNAKVTQQSTSNSGTTRRLTDESNQGTCKSKAIQSDNKNYNFKLIRSMGNEVEKFKLTLFTKVTTPRMSTTSVSYENLDCYKIPKDDSSSSYMCQKYVNEKLSLVLNIEGENGSTKVVLNTKSESKEDFDKLELGNSFTCDVENIITTEASIDDLNSSTAAEIEEPDSVEEELPETPSQSRNMRTLRAIRQSQLPRVTEEEGTSDSEDPALEEGQQGEIESIPKRGPPVILYELDSEGNVLLDEGKHRSKGKQRKIVKEEPIDLIEEGEGSL